MDGDVTLRARIRGEAGCPGLFGPFSADVSLCSGDVHWTGHLFGFFVEPLLKGVSRN